jgi:pilus assembly protein FimV
MLVGLFRSNPDAFVGNMNRLKAGQILRVPEREKLADTVPQDAVKEVRIQAANWNAYRQKIADAAGNAPASESRSVARGKIAAVEDKAAAKDAPKEVVKLSKGESAPVSGKADKGGAVSAKDRMRVLEDEAIVREKALAEANSRVVQLEKNIKDMQRLLELKGGAPGPKAEPAPPAKAEPAKAAPAKAEPPKAAEPPKDMAKSEATKDIAKAEPAKDAKSEPAKDAAKVEPAKDAEKAPDAPKAATAPKPKPVVVPPPPPEPDLLDQLTSDPLYMAGGAGILALLGVGGYVMVRRRKAGANEDEQKKTEPRKVVMAGSAAATPMAVAPVVAQAMVDDVDPLAEADLYLNFGRDAQAEEVLKDALAKNPNHQEAKVKLLQIFAGRKDKEAFETLAKDLHAQTGGAGDNWIKAAGMGYALDAGNALYAAGSSAPAAELPASGGAAGTDLDFDLELAPDGKVAGATTDIELDVGKTMIMQPGQLAGLAAGGDPSTTRDITSDSGIARAAAENAGAAAPDFTLNVPAIKPTDAAEPDLTLDAPGSDEMTQSNFKLGTAAGGNMIDFNFDSTAIIPPAAEAPPEKGYTHDKTVVMSPENQDKAAGLDVDLGSGKSAKVAGDAPPMLPELKFDDINLNFDESKAGAAKALAAGDAGTKDDHWYDVQTKFDLAKAYQEMGDKDGTREILLEVIKEGDAAQQTEAKALLDSLG